MINGQKLNIKTRLNRVMKDIEANLMKTSTFYKSFDTRDLFSRENYARDLRDFIYGSYSDLNIMEELDKADIAFVMAPFDL